MHKLDRYRYPVITDNKELRSRVQSINKHFAEVKREVDLIPKSSGLVVDPQVVSIRDCPICNSKRKEIFLEKWGFRYVKCKTCEHIYVENCILESVLYKMYAESLSDKYDRETQKSTFYQTYWSKVHEKYISIAEQLGVDLSKGSALDIGAGSGAFLRNLSLKSSLTLNATEFAEDCRDHLMKLTMSRGGRLWFQEPLEAINFCGESFDLVSMWGVLEHVYNPLDILCKISKIMNKDGLLLVLVPNLNSTAFKMLGAETPTLNPRGHINFFGRESMKLACQKSSLVIVDIFQELPVIDLMHDYITDIEETILETLKCDGSYYHTYVIKRC